MNLEQQKKQARELLRALRTRHPAALARLRQHHTRWAASDDAQISQSVALHDAQFTLAREQGFSSWPKLKAYAEPAAHSRRSRLFVADVNWIADRVNGLIETRLSAGPAALEQIREWHPAFADATDDEIRRAPFTQDDARLVYAREHGFDTWAELEARVALVASGSAPNTEPFLAAFEAIKQGDLEKFHALLRANPTLARDRGTNGNTLLNLAGSLTGKPGRTDGVAFIETLLAAGADVNDPNDRGWTPLHQAAYANRPELAAIYLAHGSATDAEAHGSGGTPLAAALFWGHREAADLLAQHSISPQNLRIAAALGRLDLVEACFTPTGSLTPESMSARGFYRPHSGFPTWQPQPDPQEVLDEALVWAAKSNRVEVMPRLLQAGACLDADPYRGTPLIWAAACNRIEASAWLLDHGANVNHRATFGGLSHGQGITALALAAQYGHLPIVKFLISRGADPTIQDDLYHSDALGAARYFGHKAVEEFLLQVSPRA